MKERFTLSMVICTLVALTHLLTSCDRDTPTPFEINKNLLRSAEWKIVNVKVDGVDRTNSFTGLTLRFEAATYHTTNGNLVWGESGTWSFVKDDATTFRRDDNVEVKIIYARRDELQLMLQWSTTTYGSGRVNSIEGEHIFTFTH